MDEKTVNVRRSVAMKAAATLAASVEPDTLDTKVRVYDWLYAGFCRELGVEASKNNRRADAWRQTRGGRMTYEIVRCPYCRRKIARRSDMERDPLEVHIAANHPEEVSE